MVEIKFDQAKTKEVKAQLMSILKQYPKLTEIIELGDHTIRFSNKAVSIYYKAIDSISLDISKDKNRVHLFIVSHGSFNISEFVYLKEN